MEDAELLAVVEVDEADKVTCQATGCGRPVFRRIHIVRTGQALWVLGSGCFKVLHGHLSRTSAGPRYGPAEGRRLTAEERLALEANTQRLIERFAAEEAARLAREAEQAKRPRTSNPARHKEFGKASPFEGHSSDAVRAAEAEAKRQLQLEMDIDPELPGWRGLIEARMRRLLG